MRQETVFKKDNDVAMVFMNESGKVVIKKGNKTRVFNQSVGFDDVVESFREGGWVEGGFEDSKRDIKAEVQAPIDSLTEPEGFKVISSEEPRMAVAKTGTGTSYLAEAAQNSLDQEVSLEIIQKVDQYIELHKQAAELKSRMEELKKPVRTYMLENNHKKIKGTKGGSVVLQDATASNSTAIYSNYELGDIAPLVSADFLNKVTESRINSEKLEGLLKTHEGLDKETIEKIKEAKIVKPGTPRFTVKK
ncbi:hypothetical protein BSP18_164 [Bacillus phage BSP18]|nr:hypothetical protein BSP18_164 [Bacillus phage BSP18]